VKLIFDLRDGQAIKVKRGAGEANFRSERRSNYQIKGEILSKQTGASKD